MIRGYASYKPIFGRVLTISFSLVLALEGIAWLFSDARTLLQLSQPSSLLKYSTIDYGPLNIFSASLLCIDSSSIPIRNSLFHVAFFLKVIYPLVSAASSILLFISWQMHDIHRLWLGGRLAVAMLWICSCMHDLLWRDETPPFYLSVGGIDIRTSSSAPSEDSSEGSSEGSL
jgi:hypothetical protein